MVGAKVGMYVTSSYLDYILGNFTTKLILTNLYKGLSPQPNVLTRIVNYYNTKHINLSACFEINECT